MKIGWISPPCCRIVLWAFSTQALCSAVLSCAWLKSHGRADERIYFRECERLSFAYSSWDSHCAKLERNASSCLSHVAYLFDSLLPLFDASESTFDYFIFDSTNNVVLGRGIWYYSYTQLSNIYIMDIVHTYVDRRCSTNWVKFMWISQSPERK